MLSIERDTSNSLCPIPSLEQMYTGEYFYYNNFSHFAKKKSETEVVLRLRS